MQRSDKKIDFWLLISALPNYCFLVANETLTRKHFLVQVRPLLSPPSTRLSPGPLDWLPTAPLDSVSLSKALPGGCRLPALTWRNQGGWPLRAFLLQGPLVLLPAAFLISTRKRWALFRKKFPKHFQLCVPTTCVIQGERRNYILGYKPK